MTTGAIPPVLKDVVAYVDVWSSDKTANYSKPFIKQLEEMGAQVSKTFNKQVTHVVFNNGHQATWRKAQKNNVKLVSVLWVGRCYDDGVRVDEALYTALNDETNPVLKNKKHRCMQPKDSPERTPENDKRMKKKLDKMMKDLVSVEPLVTDISPIIIDEENGIVYSPALQRSNYMAQRLKDMKEKRENLSPTASQMADSLSPVRLKPSLGSTPTVLKLMFDPSDDESSASAAEPGCSPDKEERRTDVDISDCSRVERPSHRKGSEEPWPSTSYSEGIKTTQSPLRCPDKKDDKGVKQKKARKSSVRKTTEERISKTTKESRKTSEEGIRKTTEKEIRKTSEEEVRKTFEEENKSAQIPQDLEAHYSKHFRKEKRQMNSASLKPERGPRKSKANEISTHTRASICPNDAASSSGLSAHGVGAELSEEAAFSSLKTPRQSRRSMVRPFTVSSESHRVAPGVTDGCDVFEDYFSPANHHKTYKKTTLPLEEDIHFPFELDPVPKKRKQSRSESVGSETNSLKKRRLEESQPHLSSTSQVKPSHEQSTVMANRRRHSALLCARTSTSDSERQRASVQSTVLTKGKAASSSTISAQSNTLESRDNERRVAAGFADAKSEGEGTDNQQINLNLQKSLNRTKAMRTLVMTSMPSERQTTVVQVVKSLGGFDIVDRVCESTTHVVSSGHRRTLNILLGIARGCWILSFEWILWCLEQRHWIPEEPYELSEQFPAAQICRLQRHLSAGEHQQDLFQGQPVMYVSQNSQPPTQSLVELIQLCGGTVCKTVRQAGLCIGRYGGRRPEGVRILSEQWILDCITHLKQLSHDNYDLEI